MTTDILLEREYLRYSELESSLSLLFWEASSDTYPTGGGGVVPPVIPGLPLGLCGHPQDRGSPVSAVQTRSSGLPCPLPARGARQRPWLYPSGCPHWPPGGQAMTSLGIEAPTSRLAFCDTSRAGSSYVVLLRERDAWAQRMAFAVTGRLGLQTCPRD